MYCVCPKCKFEYASSVMIRKGSLANLSFFENIKYNLIKREEMVSFIDCRKCGYQSTTKNKNSE